MKRNIVLATLLLAFLALGALHDHTTLLAEPAATSAPTPSIEDDYTKGLTSGLAKVSSIISVEVANTDSQSNPSVTITFTSKASTPLQRANEWMAILQPLAELLHANSMEIGEIVLVSETSGEPTGNFVTSSDDLLALYDKEITRTELLNRAQFVSFQPTNTPPPTSTRQPTKTPDAPPRDMTLQEILDGVGNVQCINLYTTDPRMPSFMGFNALTGNFRRFGQMAAALTRDNGLICRMEYMFAFNWMFYLQLLPKFSNPKVVSKSAAWKEFVLGWNEVGNS